VSALGGQLHLQAAAPVPHSLRSTRRAWASQLASGRTAEALPELLASLFSLCGQAHRSTSQLAIRAVEPALFPAMAPVAVTLQREAALEHLRRIGLDWPRLLAAPDQLGAVTARAAESLRRCPLIGAHAAASPWSQLHQWLQHEWLEIDPTRWLHAWQAGGANWLDEWSRKHNSWLAALLRAARANDTPLPQAHAHVLRPHQHEATLRDLAAALAAQESFALQPLWQGHVACTGPWARLHQVESAQSWTAWSLLGTRLAELVRLCLPDAPGQTGAGWLAWGALASGPRQGLAWVEMARGLLIHQVLLDDASTVVRACQVLAPTEWNFHPEGLVAQALADLPAQSPDLQARVQLLMAAFDPCVPFEMGALAQQTEHQELPHA